ncbi:MAG: hypothetical protein A2V90_02810 [Gammaproteobacteria bacterium RBG_16_57_12]|nr:MAG: hypothetical protein A2V90_02810 [Gammaproteobacteria bacterium RBG_16_57_12]
MDINPYSDHRNAYIDRLNNNPLDVEAAVYLGNTYYDNNEPAQAIVYYTIALQIKPDQPDVKTDLGAMYWRAGILSYAERTFREVVGDFPGFANAKLNLGLLLQQALGRATEAHQIFRDVAGDFPNEPAGRKALELLQG